tara:strand:+ start:368 stop:1474 length:1107 start_codon:yes stop_codon:yes gene_type:complete
MKKPSLPIVTLLVGFAFTVTLSSPNSWAEDYRVRVLAKDLDYPWSLAIMPDETLIITERPGNLIQINLETGERKIINGLPEVFYAGQGGLLDFVPHPDYHSNGLVYFSFASGDISSSSTWLARAQLLDGELKNTEILFKGTSRKGTANHYGGKFLFLPDGTLLLTVGDGFNYRMEAQNPRSTLGKTVRLTADGLIPADNPKLDGEEPTAIYTLGHRNPQGLAYDAITNIIYLHEHGPRGGDEINIIRKGANYGWPVASHGIDYNGAKISPFTEQEGLVNPLHYWKPSIAPSGLAVYRGNAFSSWSGKLLIGALVDREIRLYDPNTKEEKALLSSLAQRIRDVRVSKKGEVFILTDKGELLEIYQKNSS